MKKTFAVWGLATGLLICSGGLALQAETPGGKGAKPQGREQFGRGPEDRGGRRGPGGRGGRMAGSREKMRLTSLWNNLDELDKTKFPLSKEQARKVVALVRPWSSRAKMTDAEATGLHTKLSAVLTTQQKAELQKLSAQRRGGADGRGPSGRGGFRDGGPRGGAPGNDGPGGRGGWRPEGGRPGGGRPDGGRPGSADMEQMRKRREQMQNFMKTMNPFYPPTKYKEIAGAPERMKERSTQRYKETQSTLSALARKAK